jgi:FlaA1/EpsC-like NDP-sugar epimerase
VPPVTNWINGELSFNQIKSIKIEDLLERDPIKLDDDLINAQLKNKTILITGAAGSIGSELARQCATYSPKKIYLLDQAESPLHELELEFAENFKNTPHETVIADIRNSERLRNVFHSLKPQIVFHAAAYKHVPMMENDNVTEAISNNALGTYQFAKSCLELGVAKFILVSTDKAVNPTNVMGATKRLAEMICQGLQQKEATRFVIVRFGNVLASSGSVIPKFRTQIAAGGPVTVTHPDITRYFMSIPEAAQLVMQAGLMGKGGEIFVLDMGEPVKIVDLARDMIKLSGFQENEIDIKFTGLRPGEKLYEELIADGEDSIPTKHKKVRVAKARKFDASLLIDLLAWVKSSDHFDEDMLKKNLSHWVKEYSPDLNAKQKNTI